jgi:hypothetical protein
MPLPAKRTYELRPRAGLGRGDASGAEYEQTDKYDPDQQRVRGNAGDELAGQEAVQRYGAHGSPLLHLATGSDGVDATSRCARGYEWPLYAQLAPTYPALILGCGETARERAVDALAAALEAVTAVDRLRA